jgi:hypothetical protein
MQDSEALLFIKEKRELVGAIGEAGRDIAARRASYRRASRPALPIAPTA